MSHRCGGSATSYPGYFYDFASSAFTIDSTTGNTFRPFNAGTDLYNFGPLNHYQRPERRYSLGAMGHYEFSDHADVYTQLMFNDYLSIAQIAPGGNFFNSNSVNCDNPFLSAQQLGRASVARLPMSLPTTPSPCTSAVATSKAAVASSRSRTARSARCSACAVRSPTRGTTTSRCSTRRSRLTS